MSIKSNFPLTLWGLPQLAVFPVLIAIIMVVLFVFFGFSAWVIPVQVILFLVIVWALSFFRNPSRKIIPDENILYSPADGKVTDISQVEDAELGTLLRIGIFLSVFNVHINRAPCSVTINRICYKKGMFKNAMDPDSSRINESNSLFLSRLAEPKDKLLVRQISGAIARNIVCKVKENDELKQGDPFGMIKFGSRTELYLPAQNNGKYELMVKLGNIVYAGITPLVQYAKKN